MYYCAFLSIELGCGDADVMNLEDGLFYSLFYLYTAPRDFASCDLWFLMGPMEKLFFNGITFRWMLGQVAIEESYILGSIWKNNNNNNNYLKNCCKLPNIKAKRKRKNCK